jgi:hypothetical protein
MAFAETPNLKIPYLTGSNQITEWPAAAKAMAEKIDTWAADFGKTTAPTWTKVPVNTSIVDGGSSTAEYAKTTTSAVFVQGRFYPGGGRRIKGGDLLATLPADVRPLRDIDTAQACGSINFPQLLGSPAVINTINVIVKSNGQVTADIVSGRDTAWVAFTGSWIAG